MGQEVGKCMISDQGLDNFIKLYEQKYDIRLDREKAFDLFIRLIKAVKTTIGRDDILKN